ncbi:polysaccharide pyruvyl transferase family protein [Microbacterium yannicii]|uniref:polysaccharide pyruvyl transferase family protein n=1 Tax=Microbacterium yannicii TaxID=671622 RepID=UPI001ED9A21A|nr:polysaccharide pyruvyl transferase family protein [Microbacterium yannicii]
MSGLRSIQDTTMRILAEEIPPGTRVALVDFPNHQNAGDSLIWLGTRKYLQQLGVVVDYIADMSRYDPALLREAVPDGPILIQGGGNFGDRWTAMQDFRERVIVDFPDRKIIQLPQSVDFSQGERLRQAQAVLGEHRNLTLLIRDHAGVGRARELFGGTTVRFCPDLALGYGLQSPASPPKLDVLMLIRRDDESARHTIELRETWTRRETEWSLKGWDLAAWAVLHIPGAVTKRSRFAARKLKSLVEACYQSQAEINVRAATKALSLGRVVVTDRLHASVLGALIGRPVIALDNETGKVRALYEGYLHKLENLTLAGNGNEVQDRVETILATADARAALSTRNQAASEVGSGGGF